MHLQKMHTSDRHSLNTGHITLCILELVYSLYTKKKIHVRVMTLDLFPHLI